MNTVRKGQNLSLIAICDGRGNCSKSSGFMINSKCNRQKICIEALYLTCFLNFKSNSKSVDMPSNTMLPATFPQFPTFQNKPAKTEKVHNPTTFDS